MCSVVQQGLRRSRAGFSEPAGRCSRGGQTLCECGESAGCRDGGLPRYGWVLSSVLLLRWPASPLLPSSAASAPPLVDRLPLRINWPRRTRVAGASRLPSFRGPCDWPPCRAHFGSGTRDPRPSLLYPSCRPSTQGGWRGRTRGIASSSGDRLSRAGWTISGTQSVVVFPHPEPSRAIAASDGAGAGTFYRRERTARGVSTTRKVPTSSGSSRRISTSSYRSCRPSCARGAGGAAQQSCPRRARSPGAAILSVRHCRRTRLPDPERQLPSVRGNMREGLAFTFAFRSRTHGGPSGPYLGSMLRRIAQANRSRSECVGRRCAIGLAGHGWPRGSAPPAGISGNVSIAVGGTSLFLSGLARRAAGGITVNCAHLARGSMPAPSCRGLRSPRHCADSPADFYDCPGLHIPGIASTGFWTEASRRTLRSVSHSLRALAGSTPGAPGSILLARRVRGRRRRHGATHPVGKPSAPRRGPCGTPPRHCAGRRALGNPPRAMPSAASVRDGGLSSLTWVGLSTGASALIENRLWRHRSPPHRASCVPSRAPLAGVEVPEGPRRQSGASVAPGVVAESPAAHLARPVVGDPFRVHPRPEPCRREVARLPERASVP